MRGADLYLIKITTTKEAGQAFITELRHAQEYNAGWQYSTNVAYTEIAKWWIPETMGTCERTHIEKELGSCAITITFLANDPATFYIEACD